MGLGALKMGLGGIKRDWGHYIVEDGTILWNREGGLKTP